MNAVSRRTRGPGVLRRLAPAVVALAALAAVAYPTGAATAAPSASAPTAATPVAPIPIGAGTPFGLGTPFADGTSSTIDFCTIAAVGRDSADRLVALTAGHCVRDTVGGNLIELWVQGQKIGQFVSDFNNTPDGPQVLPGKYDFGFALLDESKVTPESFGQADVSAGLLAPTQHVGTFNQVCKQGATTGFTCGTYIGDGGTNPRSHISTLTPQPGDSGGPMFTPAGRLVGIASRGGPGSPVSYYTDVRDASSYATAHGMVGGGFQPIA